MRLDPKTRSAIIATFHAHGGRWRGKICGYQITLEIDTATNGRRFIRWKATTRGGDLAGSDSTIAESLDSMLYAAAGSGRRPAIGRKVRAAKPKPARANLSPDELKAKRRAAAKKAWETMRKRKAA